MKKSFGQHFLVDDSTVNKIIAAADVQATDFVVEVGPGAGALTSELVGRAGRLVLIEADKDLLTDLHEKFSQAQIMHSDAAQVDIDDVVKNEPWIFVSNLPYNAANAILMNMLTAKNPPIRSIVMVQKEVGDKIMAQPGDMSLLSVAAQMYTQPSRVCVVKPGSFNPPPKVDSVVLKLESREAPEHSEEIIQLAKKGFSSRRKQLHKNLAHAGLAESKKVKDALISLGYTETARAQELACQDWVALWKKLF